jgi:trans-aconitate methyltransferase
MTPVQGGPPQGWDAEQYELHSQVQTREGAELLARLDLAVGARLLDIGCGDGRITERAVGAGVEAVGVDTSFAMCRAAARRDVSVVQSSAAALPLASGSFDAVYSNAALHWVSGHTAVVREISRVLRPGGRLVARMGGAGNQTEITVACLRLLNEPPYRDHQSSRVRSPWTMADPAEWASELVAHGMRIEELALEHSPSGWRGPEDMVRWFTPVVHVFTAHLPVGLHRQFLQQAVQIAWPETDPDRAFVRLVVDAVKGDA